MPDSTGWDPLEPEGKASRDKNGDLTSDTSLSPQLHTSQRPHRWFTKCVAKLESLVRRINVQAESTGVNTAASIGRSDDKDTESDALDSSFESCRPCDSQETDRKHMHHPSAQPGPKSASRQCQLRRGCREETKSACHREDSESGNPTGKQSRDCDVNQKSVHEEEDLLDSRQETFGCDCSSGSFDADKRRRRLILMRWKNIVRRKMYLQRLRIVGAHIMRH